MGMNTKTLAKTLVDAAMELSKVSKQELLRGIDAVAFELQQVEGLVYAVLADLGQPTFALHILVGEQSREQREELIDAIDGGATERWLQRANGSSLSFMMTRMRGLKPEFSRVLDRASYPPSRLAPVFGVFQGTKDPRAATRGEWEIFLAVIQGLLEAGAAGKLEGRRSLGVLSRVRVAGDLRRPEISVDLIHAASEEVVERETLLAHPDYVDPKALPADDAREAWKAADQALAERITRACIRSGLGNQKAWKRYLGEGSVEDLPEGMRAECMIGYVGWHVTWFRAQKSSPTILEAMLAESTRPAERALIEARMQSRVQIVEYIAPLSALAFEAQDLMSGERLDIDDGGLTTHCRPGMGLILQVCSVGQFHLVTPMGPWYATGRRDEAMGLLNDLGIWNQKDLDRAPHLVGHLWDSADQLRRPAPPTLHAPNPEP